MFIEAVGMKRARSCVPHEYLNAALILPSSKKEPFFCIAITAIETLE